MLIINSTLITTSLIFMPVGFLLINALIPILGTQLSFPSQFLLIKCSVKNCCVRNLASLSSFPAPRPADDTLVRRFGMV